MRGQVLLMSSIPALAVLAYIFWRRKSRQYRTFSSKQVVDLSDKSLITVSGGNSTGEEKRSEEDSECHEASFSVCLELELRSSMANPREEEKEPSAAPQCISGSEEAQLSESMKEMHVSEDVGDENCLTKDQDTIPMNEEEGDLQEITSDGEVTSEVLDGRASRDSGVQPSCSSTPTSMIHSSPSPHVSHHISDTSSEVSSESERTVEIIKGESTPVKDHTSYDFELPQKYVGLLIGRLGCFVKEIRSSTGAVVEVRRHPSDNKFKICSVSGSQKEVDGAMDLIRKRFPSRRFPEVSLEKINLVPMQPTVILPPCMTLNLPSGVSFEVVVSCILTPGQVFLQQITHPTFPSLTQLDYAMSVCYIQQETPSLPMPLDVGIVAAAPMGDGWYRVKTTSVDNETDECVVNFLDYGGHATLPCSHLRQIRADFMTLPFQATEACVANITPIQGEEWEPESAAVLQNMTEGLVLQAQVTGCSPEGLPSVYLYKTDNGKMVLINRALVDQGLASWIDGHH